MRRRQACTPFPCDLPALGSRLPAGSAGGPCSTNAIESLNSRHRRAIRARGHFPSEDAALKCLYLVAHSLGPTGRVRPAG